MDRNKIANIPVALYLIAILFITAIACMFLLKTDEAPYPLDTLPKKHAAKEFKTYEEPVTGFSINYPIFFELEQLSNSVSIYNVSCMQDVQLCYPDQDSIQIDFLTNGGPKEIKENLEFAKKDMDCKDVLINLNNPLIVPINADASKLPALRCEFKEVPKQASGGYLYKIERNGILYTLTAYQSGWNTTIEYINGKTTYIDAGKYNPLLDTLVKTISFHK